MRNILIILIVFLGVYQLKGQTNITGYQYWFDDDYSNCVNTPITPASQLTIDEALPTLGLSTGIHSFHFRSFDENGLFSSTISSFFYKNLVQATAVNREIVAYEYWFDDDFNGAVTQTVTNQKNLNLITDISTGAISDGIHTFNIRVKDNTGMWSSTISSFFYKNLVQATAINRKIVAYEYWFDDDLNGAVTQTVTNQKNLNLITDISTGAIADGIHTFNIRVKDNTGMWSSIISSFFYKNFVRATAVNRKIIAYRYWVDDSFDKSVTKPLASPVKNLSLITDLDFTEIEKGEHIVHFQFQDNDKMWSVVTSDTINKQSLPIADFGYSLQSGCDTAIASFTDNSTDGDIYLWNFGDGETSDMQSPTHTYYSSGTYTVVLTVTDTVTGQDSSKTEFIDIIISAITSEINPIACDSYTSPSGKYVWNNSGTYTDTVPSYSGCDSVITVNLTINESTSSTITETACNSYESPSGNYVWTSSGTYQDTIANAAGCDSVITVNLTINESTSSTITETACNSYESPSGNYVWTSSGTYQDTIANAAGCDSVITVNLTINESTSSTITETACNSYESPSGNYVWTSSGNYQDTISNAAGCDSVITVNLTINESTSSTISATVCDSYESPSGNYVWTSSGTYQDTIANAAGCDSVITIDLTINESTSSTITETACNSYESPSGNYVWTSSGTYQDTIANAAGCDSVITINLTINESTSSTITETACNSYESPSGNYIWTSSGTYQDTIANAAGCDSVITINLTINESTSSTISATVCDSYDSPSGNYTWTSSGTYIDTLVNSAGCDSVITVNLTVHKSTNSEITVVIEESDFPYIFGTQTLTSAGEYTETFQSQNGCDSTVTLSLIVGDVIPPRLKCRAINIFLDENGSYELSETDIAAISEGSTDNITATEDLITTVSPSTFNCENVGDAWLRVYVTDEAGNKSSRGWIRCTVIDSIDLSFVPVGDIEIEVAAGICETKVEYPEISTINPCAQIEFVEGLGPDGMFPLGTTTETWRAINTSGDTAEVSFDVTVTTVNSLPTLLQLTDTLIDEDSDPVTLPLRGISYGKDCMEQGITVSAVTNNSALLTNIEINYTEGDSVGSLEFTIAPNFSGSAEVTVTVEDSEGAIVSDTFVITVSPVNDPPFVVTSVANQMVYASYELKISVSSILGELFDDIDDTTLTIVVAKEDGAALPAWATIMNDTLICTPMIADTGSYTFVVTATDAAGASSSTKFTLIVKDYPTAIDDIESGIFEVPMFPNPTKGEVTLKINSSSINDSEVIVRSITGSEVFRKSYKATNLIKLDLSEQVSGVYLVTLKHGNNSVIKKLILDKR